MANAIYPLYKQSVLTFGTTNYDLTTDTTQDGVYCALVTAAYTYSNAHQFYSVVAAAVATPDQRIVTPTVNTSGTFSGNNLTYPTVAPGPAILALVLSRRNSGPNTTWRLILFEDTGVAGLPPGTGLTPNGGTITVTWNGAGIFTL
jgi:hypothetical protein